MSEETWVNEARIVRGLRRPDVVKRAQKRWRAWRPSAEDYLKIAAACAVISLAVYTWAAAKSDTVSHG